MAGGVIIADQIEFNRLARTLHKLMNPQAYIDLCNESFDVDTDAAGTKPAAGQWVHTEIPGNSSKRIMMPLTQLGLFAQSKILPLRNLNGLSLEFELSSNASEWLNTGGQTPPSFALSDVSLKCSMLTLDSGLESAIGSKLLSGVELPLAQREYITMTQVLTSGTFDLQLTRGLSRLTNIFVTFERPYAEGTGDDGAAATANTLENNTNPPEMNLYYPTAAGDVPEWQLNISSKKFPSFPVRSRTEAYYRLRQAMCAQGSHLHNYGMSFKEFTSNSYIVSLDCERECSAAFTGFTMRNGAQVFFTMNNLHDPADSSKFPTKAYLTLAYESMITISDSGITVLE